MTILSFESCFKNQAKLKQLFAPLALPEQKYQKIMELGRSLPPYPLEYKTPEKIVKGCQSLMYLHTYRSSDGKTYFYIDSEALISRGLAALLIAIYAGEPPEVILTCPPSCLNDLGIQASLSPSRSNGLASLYLKMKQDALELLRVN
jgi:cysteine desulfuration protein SufE